jgi:Mn-dependent DtxR family transcriptional regulator
MLTESMEDYLEMIFRLTERKGYVRAVDLAQCLKVQPSSVTRMIQKLSENGFIYYEKYRDLRLTPQGERYGRFLVWRDETLKSFFCLLRAEVGVDEQVEGIEHYITPATMILIRNLIVYFNENNGRLREFQALRGVKQYPEGERLEALRAWELMGKDQQNNC